MTVIAAAAAAATATGDAGSVGNDAGVEAAQALATGAPALVIGAPRDPGEPADGLRLEILTRTGTQLVADLYRRSGLSFTVEHNGSGQISFTIDPAALAEAGMLPDVLLDPDNLVRVHYGDHPHRAPYGVAEGIITSAPPVLEDSGRWSIQVNAPGSWDVLEFGVLWPTGETGETREMSYTAGEAGEAWKPKEWRRPVDRPVKESDRWRTVTKKDGGAGEPDKKVTKYHRWPRGWVARASWVWPFDPDKERPAQVRDFVGRFNLDVRTRIQIHAAGDDTMRLYLDGTLIRRTRNRGWKRTSIITRTLAAGPHTLAARVETLTDSPGGWIAAIAEVNGRGKRGRWLWRSSSATVWTSPPRGWFPAAVLRKHVNEAADRGVRFHPQITTTFTASKDSAKSAWTAKGPVEYQIGISATELGDQLRSAGIDAAMLPGLRLCAWKRRGFDRRKDVVVRRLARWSSRAWPRVRTTALVRHDRGWTEVSDTSAAAEFGRRELTVSGGGVANATEGARFGRRALSAAGEPEETLEVDLTSAEIAAGAPQPLIDFTVADTISVATRATDGTGGHTYVPMKVMAITGSEQPSGEITFTIAGYPV